MSTAAWELVFMLVVLKLPIVYLIGVVWWAVRAQPEPYAPATRLAELEPTPCPWDGGRRSLRRRRLAPRPRHPAGAAR